MGVGVNLDLGSWAGSESGPGECCEFLEGVVGDGSGSAGRVEEAHWRMGMEEGDEEVAAFYNNQSIPEQESLVVSEASRYPTHRQVVNSFVQGKLEGTEFIAIELVSIMGNSDHFWRTYISIR